jgi:predicted dehydrogenase/threonine dehydrogenase-like Zn-dependent dehydrogenase
MLLEFGRSNFIGKVRSQPDRVRDVLVKVRTDGLASSASAVRDRLRDIIMPGYCSAGVVLAVGSELPDWRPGDRVVTNAPHAEIVRVPCNLAARIPDSVGFEPAAFTPLASIALNGLRLAHPTLGESVVVYGLGLIGQLTVQLVRAHGCRAIGIDTDADRVALAVRFGAEGLVAGSTDIVATVRAKTAEGGADAVLMTLASDSDEPLHLAAQMSRKRGRIVLVGATGLRLRRADFYEKELSFQVSCSYGPGRHDPLYEEGGQDYPLPYVRWTEKRNFEAVLALMADRRLESRSLITHRFPIDEASAAYDLLLRDEPSLGIVLTYPKHQAEEAAPAATIRLHEESERTSRRGIAGVIGAGDFARRTLIPAIRTAGIEIRTVVSAGGLSAAVEGQRAGAEFASSDPQSVLDEEAIDTVFVLTRHDTHAEMAVRALKAGKHVFVEKPLALKESELERIREALEGANRILTVGFNRRFAPLAQALRQLVDARTGPLSLVITVNAGWIDTNHWTQDLKQGGGRIVGEASHFLDLGRYLVGASIRDVSVRSATDRNGRRLDDVSHLTVTFGDGSTAAIHYLATGSRSYPKERVEAFFDGRTVAIDNWRRLRTWGVGRWHLPLRKRMDKGHAAQVQAFARAIREGGPPPVPMDEILDVSSWSIRAARLARGEI